MSKRKKFMKYAIAQISGKQLILNPGQWHDIDFAKDANVGNFVCFNKILLMRNYNKVQFGKPFLKKIKIFAKVLRITKGNKLTVLKTKPKKKYTRTKGHRSLYTRIKID